MAILRDLKSGEFKESQKGQFSSLKGLSVKQT